MIYGLTLIIVGHLLGGSMSIANGWQELNIIYGAIKTYLAFGLDLNAIIKHRK